jgi:hypothetical protein
MRAIFDGELHRRIGDSDPVISARRRHHAGLGDLAPQQVRERTARFE